MRRSTNHVIQSLTSILLIQHYVTSFKWSLHVTHHDTTQQSITYSVQLSHSTQRNTTLHSNNNNTTSLHALQHKGPCNTLHLCHYLQHNTTLPLYITTKKNQSSKNTQPRRALLANLSFSSGCFGSLLNEGKICNKGAPCIST